MSFTFVEGKFYFLPPGPPIALQAVSSFLGGLNINFSRLMD